MAFLNAAGRTVSKEGVKSFSAFDSNKKRSSVVVERDANAKPRERRAGTHYRACSYYIDETGQRQALTGKQALSPTPTNSQPLHAAAGCGKGRGG